jgi:hypothetical protein
VVDHEDQHQDAAHPHGAGGEGGLAALQQILNYVERLKARNHPHELYLFGTGHSSFDIDERIRQLGVVLDYLSKTVPGVTRLAGVRGDDVSTNGTGATAAPAVSSATRSSA